MELYCSKCSANLIDNHVLEDYIIPPMTNKSKIIRPRCSSCDCEINLEDISTAIDANSKVLIISGTAGAGKTAIGQLIEQKKNYIFIDGDAIQKKVNYLKKNVVGYNDNYYADTLNTLLILLALGYNVVVGYIFYGDKLQTFYDELSKYNITPIFRVLVPERSICLQRDIERECWTAGKKWVDEWYDEMRSFLETQPIVCIDNSNETLEETYCNHFENLL